MLETITIDPKSKQQMKEFLDLPYRIYKGTSQWVPFFRADVRAMLDPKKHPFYEHSEAQGFLVKKDGVVVGRVVAMNNRPYNRVHDSKLASFSLLDCIDDVAVLKALFAAVDNWARQRGLVEVVGPKPFSLGDGYGILVEGFEHRQMMTMMNYNHPYLPKLMETIGFKKVVDFVSCQVSIDDFRLPEKVQKVADRVLEKGTITVKSFHSRPELRKFGKAIGQVYNEVFIHNWEYYPYSKREIDMAVDNVTLFADPGLIKMLMDRDRVVGFLFAFPDMSRVIQQHQGRLNPISILHLLTAMKSTEWVSVNGAGVLPEYYGRGGNALLYSEMVKTVKSRGFKFAEFTQVAESAQQMRKDLKLLGGKEVKNHRIFRREVLTN
jgi:hypothetical protein